MNVGLCESCRYARVVRSARNSAFWQCGRAADDARFVKYPRLPVDRCDGFEPAAVTTSPAENAAGAHEKDRT
jgi:hypothetical protein